MEQQEQRRNGYEERYVVRAFYECGCCVREETDHRGLRRLARCPRHGAIVVRLECTTIRRTPDNDAGGARV